MYAYKPINIHTYMHTCVCKLYLYIKISYIFHLFISIFPSTFLSAMHAAINLKNVMLILPFKSPWKKYNR